MPDQQFSVPALPVLGPLWVVAVVISLIVRHGRGPLTSGHVVTLVTTWTYGAAVLWVTLFPIQVALGAAGNQAAWYEKFNWIPVLTIDPASFVLNVVMTVPVGVLVVLLWHVDRLRRSAGIGLIFSLVIEVVQTASNLLLSSGRTGDVNDLLANTLGAVLGWLLLQHLRRLRSADRLVSYLRLFPPSGLRQLR